MAQSENPRSLEERIAALEESLREARRMITDGFPHSAGKELDKAIARCEELEKRIAELERFLVVDRYSQPNPFAPEGAPSDDVDDEPVP